MEGCHNPYFNRWFSAMTLSIGVRKMMTSHNPYFNRWFSAIADSDFSKYNGRLRHNPYFNRWFSAIYFG